MEEFWVDLVLRLGFPVVVVLAMVKGYIVPGFIYDRMVTENQRLTTVSEEKIIPLAVEGQALLKEAIASLREAEEASRVGEEHRTEREDRRWTREDSRRERYEKQERMG